MNSGDAEMHWNARQRCQELMINVAQNEESDDDQTQPQPQCPCIEKVARHLKHNPLKYAAIGIIGGAFGYQYFYPNSSFNVQYQRELKMKPSVVAFLALRKKRIPADPARRAVEYKQERFLSFQKWWSATAPVEWTKDAVFELETIDCVTIGGTYKFLYKIKRDHAEGYTITLLRIGARPIWIRLAFDDDELTLDHVGFTSSPRLPFLRCDITDVIKMTVRKDGKWDSLLVVIVVFIMVFLLCVYHYYNSS